MLLSTQEEFVAQMAKYEHATRAKKATRVTKEIITPLEVENIPLIEE